MRSRRLARLWLLGAWLAALRPARTRTEDVRRHVYRDQTRRMGVRMTEWLRDRLRPRWLRVRRHDETGGRDEI